MKHHPLSLATFLFAILLLAGNCRKTEFSLENPTGGQTISFNISGRVLDLNNAPVSLAEVKAGGAIGTTDVNGYFTLSNVRTKKDAAYVTVQKNGYFPGSRTFVANAGTTNYVSIRLIDKKLTGGFVAAMGGQVTLPTGGSITFSAGSIVDAGSGSAYTGNVSVSAYFIDPSKPDFTSIMPGDLRGITTGNEERGLESFGMMAVELNGSGGQKLQLAAGKKASIHFPIPAALIADAPATIPLWHFDETEGLWKEEGSASKQGNEYVGLVSHFSFWNCDAPFALVDFQATVKDQNGNPVINAQVIIKKLSDGSLGCGITDANGKVSGKIPANEALQIKITDRCQSVLHTQNIGPFANDINLGTITVNVNAASSVTITGTAVNCSNAAVTNGFVNVLLDGMNFRTNINNGSFSLTIQRCTSAAGNAVITVTDLGNNQHGPASNISVTTGNVNAGQLSACGTAVDSYINYVIDGVQYAFTIPPDSITTWIGNQGQPATYVTGMTKNQPASYMYFSFLGTTTGTHEMSNLHVYLNSTSLVKNGPMTINVTEYGPAPNGFVAGNFNGTLRDSSSTATRTITCNFRVKRE